MAKVIDLTESDGDLVVLGRSLVLPSSATDTQPTPLNGALRFNPNIGKAQIYYNGAWNTIGDNSNTIGTTTIGNDHVHEISHILGLQTALGNKAPLVHNHEISSITGLAAILAGKAPIIHNHGIGDVSGLQSALDLKSNTGHSHTFNNKEKISACLPGSPPANFKLVWTSSEDITLPAGLQGSYFTVNTLPAANYTITLFKNITTNIGNVVMTPTGNVIITFTNSVGFVAGDTVTFAFPIRDSAIDTLSMTVVANKSQTIS